jgi:hypothetical protein
MFIRFYGLVIQEDGTEVAEICDAKHFEAAKDFFETLYADRFTGEMWEDDQPISKEEKHES